MKDNYADIRRIEGAGERMNDAPDSVLAMMFHVAHEIHCGRDVPQDVQKELAELVMSVAKAELMARGRKGFTLNGGKITFPDLDSGGKS